MAEEDRLGVREIADCMLFMEVTDPCKLVLVLAFAPSVVRTEVEVEAEVGLGCIVVLCTLTLDTMAS